jgi:DNA-binding response OmpR family regulator
LLTRATLIKDVGHYKFVPETNRANVHMGRLRANVDGPHEAPIIRNVRGRIHSARPRRFPTTYLDCGGLKQRES